MRLAEELGALVGKFLADELVAQQKRPVPSPAKTPKEKSD
jgi:hypothetical protein